MRRVFHSLCRVLHEAHHKPGTLAYGCTQAAFWVLIVTSVAVLCMELIFAPVPFQTKLVLRAMDRFVLLFFCIEIVLRILTYHPPELDMLIGTPEWRFRTHVTARLRYAVSPLTALDLITILGFMPALRGLRALRIVRLLAGFSVFSKYNPMLGVLRAFVESWLLYLTSIGLVMIVITVGGLSLFLIESQANPGINSPSDGLWWALVTITTVGFGDITPVTASGRLVASAVMIVGMFALAIFAGIVTTTLLSVVVRLQSEHFRMSGQAHHIIICGYESGARQLLDTMLEEHHGPDAQRDIVLFGSGKRPADIPTDFIWVDGDPTRESQLAKVRPEHADVIIVVGRRSLASQEADATTILTIFTLRRYLASRSRLRRVPLYIIAEVLENENLDHVKTAGANEVIETTRLGFAMVAHSVVAPGSGEVMSRVASASAASIYVGIPSLETVEPYGLLAGRMHEEYGISVLGVANPQSRSQLLAPPSGTSVHPGDALIYLSTTAKLPLPGRDEVGEITASLSEVIQDPLEG